MDSSVHIEVIPRLELLLTKIAIKSDSKMLSLNMLVHVSGFIASIATISTRPILFTSRVSNFNHLVFDNTIQIYR